MQLTSLYCLHRSISVLIHICVSTYDVNFRRHWKLHAHKPQLILVQTTKFSLSPSLNIDIVQQ